MLLLLPALLQSRNVCALVLSPPAAHAPRAALPRHEAQQNQARTNGGAPPGPVTLTALVRPSGPSSMSYSTSSPSRRLRKPSTWMLDCCGEDGWGRGSREMIANNAGTTQVWVLVSVMCG